MSKSGLYSKEDRWLWRTVQQTVRPFPLTDSSTKLLIGVSGGADSLALLHLLWQQLGAERLVAAHLNHKLRTDAEADAVFVAETAASWNIPCLLGEIEVADVAASSQLSLEAAGRLARYRFLAEKADEVGVEAVVVGHHADDQVETILLHLLRGSGSGGLRGMQPASQMPEQNGLLLVRPFLNTSRAEIEAYCARHDLVPREDASNEDVKFTRNRIRHELLPLLKTYNPQIDANLQQLALITAGEYAVLQAEFENRWPDLVVEKGADWLVLDRSQFLVQATAWQRLILRRAVQYLRPLAEISFQTIELARQIILENKSGMAATLPGDLEMQVTGQELIFGKRDVARGPQLDFKDPVPFAVPGEINLANGWTVTAQVVDASLEEVRQNGDRWQAFASLAEGEQLWLRLFIPGEHFQPLGMGGRTQAIADLLSNQKVPRQERPFWPIVATDMHPVWIVGQHLDNRMRVTKDTHRVVKLTCFQRAG
ncbi:MAG: tRNA lysidine(34) synthetase TilS [Ardenticatenaceae bacterium]|nr:tRNA lysidine(34) synthetase TilS [Ardenticatenaceae bacterium]